MSKDNSHKNNNTMNNASNQEKEQVNLNLDETIEVVVAEPTTNTEGANVDEKAVASAQAAEETNSVKLGWGDIAMGSGLAGLAVFGRRAATKLMVDGYNETTGDSIETYSWTGIAAHTAVNMVATAAIVAVGQKTVMKNLHPVYQGGLVIATSQMVNLIDAVVGDIAANAIVGGKAKLSDMMNSEPVVVEA